MNDRSRRLLEFGRVLELLRNYGLTEEGREQLAEEELSSQPTQIKKKLERTGLLRTALTELENNPSGHFPPVLKIINRLGPSGDVLEIDDLLDISRYELSLQDVLRLLKTTSVFHLMVEEGMQPVFPEEPGESIRWVINPDGTWRLENLPELKRLQRRMDDANKELQRVCRSYLTERKYNDYWQEAIVTERNGRTVLPIKARHHKRIPSVVQEVSTSGETCFIEPYDILQLNNDRREYENEYRREELRLLRDLTDTIRRNIPDIQEASRKMALLDGFLMRARFSRDYNCLPVDESEDGTIHLEGARHPLLGSEAVPITLSMSSNASVLIVSGPNAGGKTVALKTLGLLSLMRQFGMELPVAAGSILPVFNGIFAEIGDEQSIAMSLSTFTARLVHISKIFEQMDSGSLVLLDELGSGTDPDEGAFLAMSILDELINRGCRVMVTTHLSRMKQYAYRHEKAENASVDFDEKDLTPRYTISYGVPGESHALEIAKKSGLPDHLTERARKYRSSHERTPDAMIRSLTEEQNKLRSEKEMLEKNLEELRKRERKLHEREESVNEHEQKLREQGITELKTLLARVRSEMERAVREVREKQNVRETIAKKQELEQSIDEALNQNQASKRIKKEKRPIKKPETPNEADRRSQLQEGDKVLVGENKKRGTLIRKERGNRWLVEVGSLRMSFPEQELVRDTVSRPSLKQVEYSALSTGSEKPLLTLDLRGESLESALERLAKQLDLAVYNEMQEFSVIHGKGEGVLRRGVHEHLQTDRRVEDFFFAPPNQGGYGKTIVRLAKLESNG